MSTVTFTTCDKCNPGQSTRREDGRGYAQWPPQTAIEEFGWAHRRGVGHVCPECLEEEDEVRVSKERK